MVCRATNLNEAFRRNGVVHAALLCLAYLASIAVRRSRGFFQFVRLEHFVTGAANKIIETGEPSRGILNPRLDNTGRHFRTEFYADRSFLPLEWSRSESFLKRSATRATGATQQQNDR
jgi:hypothetical protein